MYDMCENCGQMADSDDIWYGLCQDCLKDPYQHEDDDLAMPTMMSLRGIQNEDEGPGQVAEVAEERKEVSE
jgi:hypothetical protein